MSYQEGKKFAEERQFMFLEVSAKENKFVQEAFQRPADVVVGKLEHKQLVLTPGMVV